MLSVTVQHSVGGAVPGAVQLLPRWLTAAKRSTTITLECPGGRWWDLTGKQRRQKRLKGLLTIEDQAQHLGRATESLRTPLLRPSGVCEQSIRKPSTPAEQPGQPHWTWAEKVAEGRELDREAVVCVIVGTCERLGDQCLPSGRELAKVGEPIAPLARHGCWECVGGGGGVKVLPAGRGSLAARRMQGPQSPGEKA